VIRLISNAALWNLHIAQGRVPAVQEWLRANGIEPDDVPVDADMTIEDTPDGRVIHYVANLRNDEGRVQADPFHDGKTLREQRAVPLVVEPPADWPVYGAPASPRTES
jgi:hypothetical protein